MEIRLNIYSLHRMLCSLVCLRLFWNAQYDRKTTIYEVLKDYNLSTTVAYLIFRDVMFENYEVDISRESFIAPLYWSYNKDGERVLRFRDIIGSSGCTFILVNSLSFGSF